MATLISIPILLLFAAAVAVMMGRATGSTLVPILLFFAAAATVAIVVFVKLLRDQQRKARRAGYASVSAYLREPPRTDEEKRDAVDLALKGGVVCLLGLLFPPLMLLGLLPLFYGTRKAIYGSMGLGLLDDSDQAPE